MNKDNNNKMTLPGRSALVAALLLAASTSSALEIETEIRGGIGKSDNIARTPDNEIEETIRAGGLTFNLLQESRKFNADLQLEADYIDYEDDTFDEEWISAMSLIAEYYFVEQTLSWYLQNNYGQQLVDPLSAPNPGNRDNFNYLTTGPSLDLKVGARHSIGADARFSSVKYETQPINNDRYDLGLWFGRRTDEAAMLSLNAVARRTEFDNDGLSPDYDTYDAFVRYESTTTRNVITLDVGYTEVDVEDSGGSGTLLRFDWIRTVTPYTMFVMGAGTNYSSNGDIFRFTQLNNPQFGTPGDTQQTDNPFRMNFAFANYSLTRERYQLRFDIGWTQEDYEDRGGLDREILRSYAFVSYEFTRHLFGELFAGWNLRNFDQDDREDTDTRAGAALGLRIGRSFTLRLEQLYTERDSNIDGAGYEESRTNFRMTYTPPWSQ